MAYKKVTMNIMLDIRLKKVYEEECEKLHRDVTKITRKLVVQFLENRGIREEDIFPELKELRNL